LLKLCLLIQKSHGGKREGGPSCLVQHAPAEDTGALLPPPKEKAQFFSVQRKTKRSGKEKPYRGKPVLKKGKESVIQPPLERGRCSPGVEGDILCSKKKGSLREPKEKMAVSFCPKRRKQSLHFSSEKARSSANARQQLYSSRKEIKLGEKKEGTHRLHKGENKSCFPYKVRGNSSGGSGKEKGVKFREKKKRS